jgi:Holliday junction resolvase YEN1
MGIHGIYKEIGPGRRIALSRLALDTFEKTGRPLRIAIDTSIWLFQIQASKGGTNPALRTFYYRLLRLISLDIHPVFVFDGPNKPPFKRNKRTGPTVASIPEFLAKQLLKQFGFPIHLAPGEAEAECALLQREAIVDAVLSEDVDTLMFGSGLTIRNWSPQKTGTTPTHVSLYDAVETKQGPSALDRHGMILVALMSGGDYVPEGIPGCGPKTACEAAKAGFGDELCKIPRNDARALSEWRQRLQHELKTNESKLFKRKHGALRIPDDFPRLDILGYYTHPAISTQAGLDKLRRSINWDQDLDFPGLREFTRDAFDWINLEGAKHFVRSLAPSLLVRSLRMRAGDIHRLPTRDIQAIRQDEALLVKGLHGKRQHDVTDHTPELRVSFIPVELVNIDLDNEEPDDEFELPPDVAQPAVDLNDDLPLDLEDDAEPGPKKRGPTKFDPHKPARIWVLESIVKVGVPLMVKEWEAGRQTRLRPKKAAPSKDADKAAPRARAGTRRTKTAGEAPQAQIQTFAKVTKPGSRMSQAIAKVQGKPNQPSQTRTRSQSQTPYEVVDLLTSSPVRCASPPSRPRALSPLLDDLPASVTKRRRRAPISRSHTLPAELSEVLGRPESPPLVDGVDTLDLLSSPVSSQMFSNGLESQFGLENHTARPPRRTSVPSSPVNTGQPTLDTLRASAARTKLRGERMAFDDAPISTPPRLRPSHNVIDTLDLTLSSPLDCSPDTQNTALLPPKPSDRLPLTSLYSNSSRTSARSSSPSSATTELQKKAPASKSTRRISPRLQRNTSDPAPVNAAPTRVESSGIDTLDLTSPHLSTVTPASPEIESLDLTGLSSPIAQPSLSSHPHTLTSHESAPVLPKPATPAAWKAQSKKKRQIILRKSVAGAWDFAEVDSPQKGDESPANARQTERDRRRWRESAVEVLDLT